jgi:2-amino-4-hydroxy-6-hydroxymethyldihydropteridine diphosphokinase
MSCTLIAVGANIAGRWGTPRQTLERLPRALRRAGITVTSAASIYATDPVGGGRQPVFLNTVLVARCCLSPRALLSACKGLERAAGRTPGPRNGPRPLDLDVLCHERRVVGWTRRRRDRGGLVLPHPELHRRAFVLVPLAEAAPRWRHPVLQLTARAMLARLPTRARLAVRSA